MPDPLELPDGSILHEPGWTLVRRVPMGSDVFSVAWAPNGTLYATRRTSPAAGGGVYRVVNRTVAMRIASADRPAGLAVDDQGRVFVSEDFDGHVTRIDTDGTSAQWLSGFASGDDDPAGLAFPWPGQTGGEPLGTGWVVDRGFNGADGLWSFSSTASGGEVVLADNASVLGDAIDVTVGARGVFVADTVFGGQIWRWNATASDFDAVPFTPMLTEVSGVASDPRDALVETDRMGDGLYRLDPDAATPTAEPILTGYGASGWGGVEFDASGLRLALAATDEVLVLARCDPAESVDCDGNGVADLCDLETDPSLDCDRDGVIDSCAIASGAADDCDGNGRIDTCADCPPVDIVFLVDHSSSMNDEGAALCNEIDGMLAQFELEGLRPQATILGLNTGANATYPCLEDSVPNRYGVTWPSGAPASIGVDYLACPGGNQVAAESWGGATALAAANHVWRNGALRLIVPLGDEGPWCGDPVGNANADADVTTFAADVANANGVVVSPLTGTGSSAAVIALAQQLALATEGTHSAIAQADTDLAGAVINSVEQVCQDVWDCNDSGRSDACELLEGEPDCDGNGRIDTCDVDAGLDPGTCDP